MAASLASRGYSMMTNWIHALFATVDEPAKAQAALPERPVKSRFRLDNDSSATLILPDGRKLGYAQYGPPDGRAVFYHHGLPGSRIEAAVFDEMAIDPPARIIAVDRPGYGWSSPHPGRTLLDHAKDVEHLANHLELNDYGVLGISGGGTYALASAAALPADKLKGVAIIAGLGPPDIGLSGMNWMHWLGFSIGWRYLPGPTRWYFQRDVACRLDLDDETRLEMLQRQFSKPTAHPKDVEALGDPDFLRLYLRTTRESFAQGLDGMMQDGKLIASDFGFRVEDIRPDLPVRLWYGKLDTHVPYNHGEQIAARLGGGAHLRVEDETHASLTIRWRKRVLEDLVRSM